MSDQPAHIVPFEQSHIDAVVGVGLRAWAPVFCKLQTEVPSYIYEAFYPNGWDVRQEAEIRAVCKDKETTMFVALFEDKVAGFMGLRVHAEDSMGEVYIIAVDPAHQRSGIGVALLEFALQWMREKNLSMAMVETGGDAGHAPARSAYQKAGFEQLPMARYFRAL